MDSLEMQMVVLALVDHLQQTHFYGCEGHVLNKTANIAFVPYTFEKELCADEYQWCSF